MALFNQISLIGVGLIGGSLAKSIRKKRISKKVVGFFRNELKLKQAIKKKIVDAGFLDLKKSVKNSDLIILALPVNQIINFLAKIKKIVKSQTLIIDIGSTKSQISALADKLNLNFLGTHPLSGSEKMGCAFSSDTLFEDSLVIITPTKKTKRQSIKKIKSFWKKLNTRIATCSPNQHDKMLSLTSHLPHLVAFSLINSIPKQFLKIGASGLKDTTRIALSDSSIWADIFLSNKKELLLSLNSFERRIKEIKKSISMNKKEQLIRILNTSKNKREKID